MSWPGRESSEAAEPGEGSGLADPSFEVPPPAPQPATNSAPAKNGAANATPRRTRRV